MRVTAQGRYALTRLRVPDLKCPVHAPACYFCAVWAVNHREDPAFAMRLVSTRSNSGSVRKLDFFFNLTNLSARSPGTWDWLYND